MPRALCRRATALCRTPCFAELFFMDYEGITIVTFPTDIVPNPCQQGLWAPIHSSRGEGARQQTAS